ncbi:MAG: hypothetical protein SPL30_06065 [Succinivibrio sp.]|nr:hypothetical protein [Succinivibrio sp.]
MQENKELKKFKKQCRQMIIEKTGDYFKKEFENKGILVYFIKEGDSRIWVKDKNGERVADNK